VELMAGMALLTFACVGMVEWAETVPVMRYNRPILSNRVNGSCRR